MPEFYMIPVQKINKIPEFYTTFARKMPEFYIIIARKIFFPEFWGARALSVIPTPMAQSNHGSTGKACNIVLPAIIKFVAENVARFYVSMHNAVTS